MDLVDSDATSFAGRGEQREVAAFSAAAAVMPPSAKIWPTAVLPRHGSSGEELGMHREARL
ncbi:hypothetical protein [Actinomadura sp. WAC 06369]|uniref:hypothetical protein n=1 Tax=Actinomadura sp. WAC 06369 TaxID=2203193 RepID=UPI000F7AE4B8|nr:hypothetical protein [Actinomadura sp. WAC 06369]